MSWELSVPDNEDLSAKSAFSVAAIRKTYFLNVLEIGVPFDSEDSIGEAASRRFLVPLHRKLWTIMFLQSTVVLDERLCWISHPIWRQIVKRIGETCRECQF